MPGRAAPTRLGDELRDLALRTTTASLTTELLSRGFRNTFLRGLTPLRPDLRMVGTAFTLRYAPSREDVAFEVNYDNRTNVQRLAVEGIGTGEVLVIDARGDTGAASFGHIIATRLLARGAAGLVTDGALRDAAGFRDLDLPSYAAGAHATTSSIRHHPVDMNVPIGCGDVLVMPSDVVVGDAEGVVVIPRAVAEEVIRAAHERDDIEDFILEKIRAGAPLEGTYPPSDSLVAEFEAAKRMAAVSPGETEERDVEAG